MKTFKQHLSEGTKFSPTQMQWDGYDMFPGAENALEALNSYVGSVGAEDVLNPSLVVSRLRTDLNKLGYHFEMNALDKEGTTMFPLTFGGGAQGVSYDENPYGEMVEDDGISKHIEGGVSLMVTVTPGANGKHSVQAEIVRNRDMSDME